MPGCEIARARDGNVVVVLGAEPGAEGPATLIGRWDDGRVKEKVGSGVERTIYGQYDRCSLTTSSTFWSGWLCCEEADDTGAEVPVTSVPLDPPDANLPICLPGTVR